MKIEIFIVCHLTDLYDIELIAERRAASEIFVIHNNYLLIGWSKLVSKNIEQRICILYFVAGASHEPNMRMFDDSPAHKFNVYNNGLWQ